MNKLLDYIKKNYILLIILAVSWIIFGIFATRKVSLQVQDTTTKFINWEQKYDSLSESIIKNKISAIKIVETNQILKNNSQKTKLNNLKTIATESENKAHSDVKFTATCDSALIAKNNVISKQDTIIRGDSIIYSLLLSEIQQKDSLNSVVVVSRDRAYKKIDDLNSSNKRSFIEKNGIFVGGGISVIFAAFAKFVLFK